MEKQLKSLECFKRGITELVSNYIKTIDDKITTQDLKIYITDKNFNLKLDETVLKVFGTARLDVIYNEETESLNFVLNIGGEE